LIIYTYFKDEEGEYWDVDKVVEITKDNGEKVFLHDVLHEVICFWDKYLYKKGLIAKEFKPKAPSPMGKLKMRTECKNMDIETIQGMALNVPIQFRQWSYKKNRSIPIDLTNSQVNFRVRKPKPAILTPHIQVRDKKNKKILEMDINLTEKDSKKFNSFKTDQERLSFTESLEYVQKQVREHLKELKK